MPAPQPAPEPTPRAPWWWSERLPYTILIALGPIMLAAIGVQVVLCGLVIWRAAAPHVLPILDAIYP